ncbi:MAG: hypothetical protein AB1642_08930 [Pseudomonadota bacterium]
MKAVQRGFLNGGMLVILISGVVIGGLFIHSYATGQALPLWPAVAVIGVNLFGVWKILGEVRARRQRPGGSPPADGPKP